MLTLSRILPSVFFSDVDHTNLIFSLHADDFICDD